MACAVIPHMVRQKGGSGINVSSGLGRGVYPGWKITDEDAQDAQLPWFLKKLGADPHWYRLRRE